MSPRHWRVPFIPSQPGGSSQSWALGSYCKTRGNMCQRDQESCSSQAAVTQQSSYLDRESDMCGTQMVKAVNLELWGRDLVLAVRFSLVLKYCIEADFISPLLKGSVGSLQSLLFPSSKATGYWAQSRSSLLSRNLLLWSIRITS